MDVADVLAGFLKSIYGAGNGLFMLFERFVTLKGDTEDKDIGFP